MRRPRPPLGGMSIRAQLLRGCRWPGRRFLLCLLLSSSFLLLQAVGLLLVVLCGTRRRFEIGRVGCTPRTTVVPNLSFPVFCFGHGSSCCSRFRSRYRHRHRTTVVPNLSLPAFCFVLLSYGSSCCSRSRHR